MKPGIYSIPYEQYESIDAANKHLLDALAISPLHCWAYYKNPERRKEKETPAKLLGNAIHVAILEPERFDSEYVCEPDIRDYPGTLNTLEDYKAKAVELNLKKTGTKPQLKKAILASGGVLSDFWEERYSGLVQGRKVLSKGDWYAVKAISARVRKHPEASQLFSAGKSEQSIFWTDAETGVSCKARLDWVTTGDNEFNVEPVIVDLKSTMDASPAGFQRSVAKYRYYVQAAMYLDGLAALGYKENYFIFAAWEKKSPYASALYYATPGLLEAGRQEYKRLLKIYAKCLETDEWGGYSHAIEPISLPENWKITSSENELEQDWLDEMEVRAE